MLPPIHPDFSINLPGLRTESLQGILSNLQMNGSEAGTVVSRLPDGQTELQIGDRFVSLFLGKNGPEPGTTFTARLVEGRLVLNLDPPIMQFDLHRQVFDPGSRNPALELTIRSLIQTLTDMGLSPDVQNLTLARAFMIAGLPLSAPILRELRGRLDSISGRDLPALALAIRKGLPLTSGVLTNLTDMLQPRESLTTILNALTAAGGKLPHSCAEIRETIADISAALGERGELPEADALEERAAFLSGAFESALAEGRIPYNLKAILYRILAAGEELDNPPPEMREILELARSAISQLTRGQIESLRDPVSGNESLLLEIPIRLGTEDTLLELRIQREWMEDGSDSMETGIVIRLEMSAYGTFMGRLTDTPAGLYVTLHSEKPDGRDLLSRSMEDLRKALENLGFRGVRVRVGTVGWEE